MMLDDYKLTR